MPLVYPILDTDTLLARGCPLIPAAQALLDGGARMLQFRHKQFWSRDTLAEAEKVADLCESVQAVLVINDRADYAKLLGAGVHLGQDDLAPEAARELLGPDALIGLSTHNSAQMACAHHEPVDYVALGPIFGTASKRNPDPEVGLENLRNWRPLAEQPLVAIGGITRANAAAVWASGADLVAVIGDLYPENCTPDSIRDRMAGWIKLTSG